MHQLTILNILQNRLTNSFMPPYKKRYRYIAKSSQKYNSMINTIKVSDELIVKKILRW